MRTTTTNTIPRATVPGMSPQSAAPAERVDRALCLSKALGCGGAARRHERQAAAALMACDLAKAEAELTEAVVWSQRSLAALHDAQTETDTPVPAVQTILAPPGDRNAVSSGVTHAERVVEDDMATVVLDLNEHTHLLSHIARAVVQSGHLYDFIAVGHGTPGDNRVRDCQGALNAIPAVREALRVTISQGAAEALRDELDDAALELDPCRVCSSRLAEHGDECGACTDDGRGE